MPAVTEHSLTTDRHTTFFLACGPEDGTPVIMTHGWPELSLSWRHQLPFLGAMGFRAIAPDMRGYGRSTVYENHDAYAQEHAVTDMLELLDHLGSEKAIWIGHDWGSPVAWNVASHHPERCHGVASLCVPFASLDLGLDWTLTLADRRLYPEEKFPAAQWDYMRHYEENFDAATRPMDANPKNFVTAIFRKGDPAGHGQPAGTASTRRDGGWMGGAPEAPALPIDTDVISEEDLAVYAAHLATNGFSGPNAWYMNHERNAMYGSAAVNDGRLDMPALFMAARYDFVCESITSSLAVPMRERCSRLTETIIDSGHWMAQEKPIDVNRTLAKWIVRDLPHLL